MAETVESAETTRARAQTADAEAQRFAQPRQVNQDVNVQNPDTKEWFHFAKDEEVPDWALTVLGAGMFRVAAEPSAEINLGPVPGFGQSIPSTLIGEDGPAPSLGEQSATGIFIPEGMTPPEATPDDTGTTSRRRRVAAQEEAPPTPPAE